MQADILELLRDLRSRLGVGILLITHDMGVVADLADRVVVMHEGKVVEQGTVDRDLRAVRNRSTPGSCWARWCRWPARRPRRLPTSLAS